MDTAHLRFWQGNIFACIGSGVTNQQQQQRRSRKRNSGLTCEQSSQSRTHVTIRSPQTNNSKEQTRSIHRMNRRTILHPYCRWLPARQASGREIAGDLADRPLCPGFAIGHLQNHAQKDIRAREGEYPRIRRSGTRPQARRSGCSKAHSPSAALQRLGGDLMQDAVLRTLNAAETLGIRALRSMRCPTRPSVSMSAMVSGILHRALYADGGTG